jgi:hypothetical protein
MDTIVAGFDHMKMIGPGKIRCSEVGSGMGGMSGLVRHVKEESPYGSASPK